MRDPMIGRNQSVLKRTFGARLEVIILTRQCRAEPGSAFSALHCNTDTGNLELNRGHLIVLTSSGTNDYSN